VKPRWIRWAGHVANKGEMRNANRILVGIPPGKCPLVRLERIREGNFNMDFMNRNCERGHEISIAKQRRCELTANRENYTSKSSIIYILILREQRVQYTLPSQQWIVSR
jgi:hypothetical protein